MSRRQAGLSSWEIWRAPLLMAMLSVVGLLAALLADGLADWVSWASLLVLVLVCCRGWFGGAKPAGSMTRKKGAEAKSSLLGDLPCDR